jgi:hypothetical protein
MWQVNNRTPFAVDRDWVRDRHGAEVWVVVVKATFDIKSDGSVEPSEEQPPVVRSPEYHGDPKKSSLKYDTDIVLTKNRTDVVVNGHACAPRGTSATALDVSFRVGPIEKSLRVFGDRRWNTVGISAPQPFTKMPILYERAFGGLDPKSERPDRDWDWRNPVGRGFAVDAASLDDAMLPNIEWPHRLISSRTDRPEPAGYGAIASHWQPRVSFAGTYDDHWIQTRHPLLPEDLDDRFFQCVGSDQQAPGYLSGGESVQLTNLTPDGVLEFTLPKLYLGFDTHFHGGDHLIHDRRHLHTVVLEPDYPRLSLVWQSTLACHSKVHKLRHTIVTLKDLIAGNERPLVEPVEGWPA